LELDGATMRARIDACMDRIAAHIESLPEQDVGYDQDGAAKAQKLIESVPEQGTSLDDLLDIVFDRAVPESFNTASHGYLAYIPGGGIFDASLADLISNTINRYTGVWLAAPLLVQLEANAIRWLCEVMGFPHTAFGLITSGGSMSNFTAIVSARRTRLPENFLHGVIYTSDQAHYSIRKAALMAGFPEQRVVAIESDDRYRLQVEALSRRITADRAAGLQPFFCVGSAGTVNTGAVNDLPGLAELCAREQLWLHIDAAYGGFFQLTARGKRRLAGIERADSIALDPHKGLFLPYGTGVLLVRDGDRLRQAHQVNADYMPNLENDPELQRPDFCSLSPELSRPYRGLRLWLVLRLHGLAVFRRYLDEKLDLAQYAAERIAAIPGIEMIVTPELSLFAFRLRKPACSIEQLNALNRELLDLVLARQRVWLSGTMLGGRFVLRICVLSFRTHRDRINAAIEDIHAGVEALK